MRRGMPDAADAGARIELHGEMCHVQFSSFQREQIARFAAASQNLHRNQVLVKTPGMTKPALAAAMRVKKSPEIDQQAFDNTAAAFTELAVHRDTRRRIDKVIVLAL